MVKRFVLVSLLVGVTLLLGEPRQVLTYLPACLRLFCLCLSEPLGLRVGFEGAISRRSMTIVCWLLGFGVCFQGGSGTDYLMVWWTAGMKRGGSSSGGRRDI